MKILKPIEFLYQCLTWLRNRSYDYGFISRVKLTVPVVSVGNLSFGGVGKTPFTIWLAEQLSEDEVSVSVVCKSYKSLLNEAAQVDLKRENAAQYYGDEACLTQQKLPGCLVWSGPIKYKTAQAAVKLKPKIIIVDDGFSHRKLCREVDLVLIDAAVGFNAYQREPISELKRASGIVITKAQTVSLNEIEKLKKTIVINYPHLKNKIYIASTRISTELTDADVVYAFCGLATPDNFFKDLKKIGCKLLLTESFLDHQVYSESLQKKILARFFDLKNENKNVKIITTAKDYIKLTHPELAKLVQVADHQLVVDFQTKEDLIGQIRSAF